MAMRRKVRETSWGDTHGHVHCVEGDAEESHGCRWRAVFVWRGLEAKVDEQATNSVECFFGFSRNFCSPKSSM